MLVAFGCGLVAVMALLVILGGRDENKTLALPVSTCRDAVPSSSAIKVSGIVRSAAPMMSPITNKPCVYYRVNFEIRTGGRTKAFGTGPETTRWAEFSIEDTTGALQVFVDGADVTTAAITSTARHNLSPDAFQFASGYVGHIPTGTLVHVTEEVIHPGASVTASGTVRMTESGRALFVTNQCFVTDLPEKELRRRSLAVSVIAAVVMVASLAFGAYALIVGISAPTPHVHGPVRPIDPSARPR